MSIFGFLLIAATLPLIPVLIRIAADAMARAEIEAIKEARKREEKRK